MENEKKSERTLAFGILKFIALAALACLVMWGALKLHLDVVPEKIAELEEKGNMDNTIWLIEYGTIIPPVIAVAIILTVGYKLGYVKVASQREKALIILIAMLFTYGVLLPDVIARSAGWMDPPLEGEEDVVSVLEQSIGWFCAQIVPFAIALGYHLVRASSEKKELCNDEK